MLLIRDAQMRAIGEGLRAAYERTLTQHFTTLYPRETREAGEAQIAKLVSIAAKRAVDQGYGSSSREIGLYVSLAFVLGIAFDEDPQIPWAGQRLSRPSETDSATRIGEVYQIALEYLGATAGEECEHVVRAMLRIRSFDLDNAPATEGEQWIDDMAGVLHDIHPRKYDYQGEIANRNLLAMAIESAHRNGFRSPRGRGIWATLMFMLGSGFDRDPLYGWVHDALAGDGEEMERVARLYRGALLHIEHSLTPDSADGAA